MMCCCYVKVGENVGNHKDSVSDRQLNHKTSDAGFAPYDNNMLYHNMFALHSDCRRMQYNVALPPTLQKPEEAAHVCFTWST